MSLVRFLLDEHIDPDVRRQLTRHQPEMVVWKVGDPGAPQRGWSDRDILLWCEANEFLLVTYNRKSMPSHLRAHLNSGHHIPAILTVSPGVSIGKLVEELRLIWAASEAEEYRDLLLYLPFTD